MGYPLLIASITPRQFIPPSAYLASPCETSTFAGDAPIYLLEIFGKNERADLSKAVRGELAKVALEVKVVFRGRACEQTSFREHYGGTDNVLKHQNVAADAETKSESQFGSKIAECLGEFQFDAIRIKKIRRAGIRWP
jgi:hypothetical protein